VAATFEKANTYVFAAPIIRDPEVGGSNPLAPTNNLHFTNYTESCVKGLFSPCGQFVDKFFSPYGINCSYLHHYLQKPPKKLEKVKVVRTHGPIHHHAEPCALEDINRCYA
jgi:hypothetical protein